jgi:hypothetical protein
VPPHGVDDILMLAQVKCRESFKRFVMSALRFFGNGYVERLGRTSDVHDLCGLRRYLIGRCRIKRIAT